MTKDQRQLYIDYKLTFNTESGRRVLADLRHRTIADKISHCPSDTNQLVWDEAQRSMIMAITKAVEADIDAPTQTMAIKEQAND